MSKIPVFRLPPKEPVNPFRMSDRVMLELSESRNKQLTALVISLVKGCKGLKTSPLPLGVAIAAAKELLGADAFGTSKASPEAFKSAGE